jgi:predicted deacylase
VSFPRLILRLLPRLLLAAAVGGVSFSLAQEGQEPGADSETAEAEVAQKPVEAGAIRAAPNVDLSEVVVEPEAAEPDGDEESTSAPQGADDVISAEASAADESPDPQADESAAEAADESHARSLVLLNAEVAPGTSTRLSWSPRVSFMGVSAPTPVLVVNGVNPGPTLCLTAAVHGDETNGIETVRRVLYGIDAEKLSGAVIGVPIVNLESFRARSRYLPDRRDLNRFFPGNTTGSAASRIAFSFFEEVIRHCEYLIDLHTGSFGRTNLQQVRADLRDPGVRELSEKLGRIVVVQSPGTPGTLRRAATEAGIPTVTLEAGGPNILDRSVVEESVESIRNAMSGLGLLNRSRWLRRVDAPVFYRSVWIRANDGGFLISETRLGAEVDVGSLLGVVTNPITNQRSEIRSPFAGRVIGMALNQVMQPGYAAYHLGIEPEEAPVAGAGRSESEHAPGGDMEYSEDVDSLESLEGRYVETDPESDADDDGESGR